MPKPRRPIPEADARRLKSLTRRIRAVNDLADERGALMADLRDRGYSDFSIAEPTGSNEEGVRRAIARYKTRAAAAAESDAVAAEV